MNELLSETEFAAYLDSHSLSYERDYHVGPGNFDFRINGHTEPIYCDVKEIRDSDVDSIVGIDADLHLRSDIRKLRNKYKGKRLDGPVVLVTMNFSSNYFTGLTIARALMGNVGIMFDRRSLKSTKPLHHLPRGNAVFTKNQNTSISGVFVYDRANSKHVYFQNPYADTQMSKGLCTGLKVIRLSKNMAGQELIDLGNLMFWNIF
jgi:hypothetical protein